MQITGNPLWKEGQLLLPNLLGCIEMAANVTGVSPSCWQWILCISLERPNNHDITFERLSFIMTSLEPRHINMMISLGS